MEIFLSESNNFLSVKNENNYLRQMRWLFLFLGVFIFRNEIYSQSTVDKTIDATELHQLEIDLDNTFQIEIVNNHKNQIVFSAIAEGEFEDKLLINAERNNTTLIIKEAQQPFVRDYNDKLSAHKVHAIKVIIEIPDNLEVFINSRNASISVSGNYKLLVAELFSGDCKLHSFMGNATINTINGNIEVQTLDAVVSAISKLGEVHKEHLGGTHVINLNSVRGNINVIGIE